MTNEVEEARQKLIEAVAEFNNELLEKYIEGVEIAEEEVAAALIEGIQAYEKVRVLKAEFEANGNTRGTKKIEALLAPFKGPFAPVDVTKQRVERAMKQLNTL